MRDIVIRPSIGRVTVEIESNGRRGQFFRPAQTLLADIIETDEPTFIMWDCPACGYADSFESEDDLS